LRRHARPRPARGFTILRVRRNYRVPLRVDPGGRIFRRIGDRTGFGSRQTLTVAARRGRWLGVTTSERPNGRLAWVDGRSDALARRRTRVALRIDRSGRRLQLRIGGRTLRSVPVGVGAPGSPTPTGRFAVTDKLSGAPYRGVYGCCILALSGEQPRPPASWRGGRRLAIHGTAGRAGAFTGSSAGCVRADRVTMRLLMRRVPLGTPVFVTR
jgi:lipoprotein-anchoring transpeptidase ErfK/SrfK